MTLDPAWLERLEVVAFDLDNTLYDEGLYFEAAFASIAPELARRAGVERSRVERRLREILAAHGKHYHYLFSDVLAELGLDPEADLGWVLSIFRSVDERLEPFPGVRELLAELRGRYRLGLITSGMQRVQENKLRLLGLEDAFEAVVFSSALPENKPGQLPFRHLLDRLGVPPERAVYVGDNPLFDFRGANELGMLTVRVANPELDGLRVARADDARIRLGAVAELGRLLLGGS